MGGFLALSGVLALLSIVAIVRSLAAMTYLNIRLAHEVDPASRAVSYYVFYGDGRQVFATSVAVIAVGSAMVLIGMRSAGVRLGIPATAFFVVWCTSLSLVAIFPTDNGKHIASVSGLIHQIAGASLFVSLPLAARSLAKRLAAEVNWARTARVLRAMALAAMVLAAAYLATRLPDLLPGLALPGILDGRGVSGLVQRALFALELLMLIALAVRLLRVVAVTRRELARAP